MASAVLSDFRERWIIFVGDFVDRGPESKEVLDFVIQLRSDHSRTTACMGNHELAMAGALELVPTPELCKWRQRYLASYESESTFASYGVAFGDLVGLQSAVPQSHKSFLSMLPWCIFHPEYLVVHAGLLPNVPFEEQKQVLVSRDFTLRKPEWLCNHALAYESPPSDCPFTVISGHVKVPFVTFLRRRILIDVSGGLGTTLCGLLIPEKQVLSVGT